MTPPEDPSGYQPSRFSNRPPRLRVSFGLTVHWSWKYAANWFTFEAWFTGAFESWMRSGLPFSSRCTRAPASHSRSSELISQS